MRKTTHLALAVLAPAALAGAVVLALAQAPTPTRADGAAAEYVGANSCKKCHLKQFKSWGETPHAKAFDTLKPGAKADKKKAAGLDPAKDYTKDAACVRCHVTGHGKPADKKASLENVQCETCHGPGSLAIPVKKANEKFKMAEIEGLGRIVPDAKLCATCHNEESPTVPKGHVFDFEKMMKEGVHEHLPLKFEH